MKRKLIVEIEVPENIPVLPEEGKDEEDFETEELKIFREQFAKDLTFQVTEFIKNLIEDSEMYEDDLLDDLADGECSIESFESLEDYKIKISVKEE